VKDLQYLNRDLSKVIMIDTREGSFVRAKPRNGEEGEKAGMYHCCSSASACANSPSVFFV
jgi:hypothetical protein